MPPVEHWPPTCGAPWVFVPPESPANHTEPGRIWGARAERCYEARAPALQSGSRDVAERAPAEILRTCVKTQTIASPFLGPKSCRDSIGRRPARKSAKLSSEGQGSKYFGVSRISICSLARLTGAIPMASLRGRGGRTSSEARRYTCLMRRIPGRGRDTSAIFCATCIESSEGAVPTSL